MVLVKSTTNSNLSFTTSYGISHLLNGWVILKHQFCSFHNDHQSSIKMLSKKYVKITDSFGCQRTLCIGPKKVVLLQEIDRVKKFLSLTRPHSWMYIRIHIYNFKKQTNRKKKQTRIQKKQKKLKKKRKYLRKID